jgi:actin-like ATPase involved in cell morphogenesis
VVAEFAAGVVLGIDFGSSNTAAAFRDRHGFVQELRLSTAGSLMPSAVFYDGSRFLVGRTALQAAFTSPEAFEPSPKRRLADREIFLAGGMIAVTEMVAAVFAEVLARAAQVMGAAPDVVVVTHPDQWSAPLQQLLAQSACAGGVDPQRLRLVSEAQAAAWFYANSAPAMAVGARLVVFDFGAGTCDVAVLERQPDHSFAVIASDGLDGLGGHDLDARIQAWVRRQLSDSDPVLLAEVNDSAAIATRLALNDRIRDAKEALSEASSAAIVVAASAGTQVLQLTRDEFDELIGPDIDRAVGLTKRVMAEAQQRRPCDQTPTIYLTGGSAQIPLVHSRLSELAPVGVLGDPKMVVAQGALYTPAATPQRPQPTPTPTAPTPLIGPTPTHPPPPHTTGAPSAPPSYSAPGGQPWPVHTGSPPPPQFGGGPPVWTPPGSAPGRGKRIALVLASAVALAVAAVLSIWFFWLKPAPANPDNAGPTPSAAGTATPTSVNYNARLFNLIPSGYNPDGCQPSAPVQDALATIDCGQNSDPGGPAVARYSLFATATALHNAFTKSMSADDRSSPCPGSNVAPDTWFHTATPNQVAGSLACGTYHNDADMTWTNEFTLVLADARGSPNGPSIEQIYNWWGSHS